ncbi:MAG: zinc-dependent metalloprotease [Vitreoscilla sp.]|nr:zinc-dependent metalloprotease [Vitreoscilla sp.]
MRPPKSWRPAARSLSSTGLLLSLAACTTVPVPASSPAAAPAPASAPAVATAPAPAAAVAARPAASGPAAPAAAPAAGTPPPFATVTKDARRIDGLIAMWQKEDKVWFELKPEDLSKPMFLSPKMSRGIGEQAIFGGSLLGQWQPYGRPQIVEFRRLHNLVQLVARNDNRFGGAGGTPEARSVAGSFSDSLLGSAPLASQPHPDSKAVLVEANAIFVADLLGFGINLQRTYRQNYAFDPRNSSIAQVRADKSGVVLEVSAHFASASLAFPQPGAPAGAPVPTLPTTLPDARSMFLGLHYSLSALPEQPMASRRADPRVGYFTNVVQDFGDPLTRTPNRHQVVRWRLDKKDPAAALSEPVRPITYWLDRNIPLRYRESITKGVLAWNAAFEKIGFKDAIVVKQQPDDAAFDTLDLGVASIRWMSNAQPAFGAIGPRHFDPRTGEILDADIGIESLSSRNLRSIRAQILGGSSRVGQGSAEMARLLQIGGEQHLEDALRCEHGAQAGEQLAYALDVLEARGDIDPDSPEAEAFVQTYLTDVTMHEVGHTLGLRHNFRSSRIYTDQQLSDPAFTLANGLAGSVMEYAALNLPRPGERAPAAFQTTLGPYDYWAIEYGYKPAAEGATPAEQEAELKRIAARSNEPGLAYGTDEDNLLGLDPESLLFDLGDDPLVFARKRIAIAQDLLARQETRPLKPTEDYTVLRRSLGYALRDAARAAGVAARQIGGLRTLRDFPGSGRDPLQPVPAAVQREALDLLLQSFLKPGSFRISPALARKLAPDYLERMDVTDPIPTDFSVEAFVLDLQRSLLTQLMSDGLAARLLDAQAKAASPREAFGLAELYGRLTREVWAELAQGSDIVLARRELQREHLGRLAQVLLRPTPASRADARGLWRAEARALLERLQGAAQRGGLSPEARAHLSDSTESLRAALAAPLQRAGI